MRPASIVNFERIVLITIVIGLAATVLNWEAVVAMARSQSRGQFGSNFVLVVQALSIALYLLLLWLIARRRSVVAMWIYVVLAVAGLLLSLRGLSELGRMPLWAVLLQAAQWLLTLASLWLLFRPDARAWFRGAGSAADPA
jgi:hypothetical protein